MYTKAVLNTKGKMRSDNYKNPCQKAVGISREAGLHDQSQEGSTALQEIL